VSGLLGFFCLLLGSCSSSNCNYLQGEPIIAIQSVDASLILDSVRVIVGEGVPEITHNLQEDDAYLKPIPLPMNHDQVQLLVFSNGQPISIDFGYGVNIVDGDGECPAGISTWPVEVEGNGRIDVDYRQLKIEVETETGTTDRWAIVLYLG